MPCHLIMKNLWRAHPCNMSHRMARLFNWPMHFRAAACAKQGNQIPPHLPLLSSRRQAVYLAGLFMHSAQSASLGHSCLYVTTKSGSACWWL